MLKYRQQSVFHLMAAASMSVVSTVAMTGCNDDTSQNRDAAAQAINDASHAATNMTPGEAHLGVSEEGGQSRTTEYAGVATKAGNAANSGLSGQQQAGRSLEFDAALGQARVALEDLRRAEAELSIQVKSGETSLEYTDPIAAIQRDLDAALSQAASIEGARQVSFLDGFRLIDAQEAASKERKLGLTAQRGSTQARIDDLAGKIAAEQKAEAALRDSAAEVKSKIAGAPIEERIAMIDRAAAISRDADTHQVKASELEALLDTVRPQLEQAETLIKQCDLEIRGLQASRADLQGRESALKAEIAARSASLQEIVARVNEMTSAYASARTATISPRQEEAIAAAEKANGSARSSAAGSSGAVRSAVAAQVLGAAYWEKASSQAAYAAMASRLAQHATLLGKGDEFKLLAEQLGTEAATARAAAEEAYLAAADALENAPEGKERDDLLGLVRASADLVAGREASAATPTVTKDPNADEGQNDAALADRDADIAAIRSLYKSAVEKVRAGDTAGFFAMVVPPTDEVGKTLFALAEKSENSWAEFNAACRSKYGQDIKEMLNDPALKPAIDKVTAANPMMGQIVMGMKEGGSSTLSSMAELDFDTVEFTFDDEGNTASIKDIPNVEAFAAARQDDGQWRLTLNTQDPAVAMIASNPMAKAMINSMTDAFDSTRARVEANEFQVKEQMIAAFLEEFGKALAKAAQGGG